MFDITGLSIGLGSGITNSRDANNRIRGKCLMNEKPDLAELVGIDVLLHDFLGIELGYSKDGIAEVHIPVTRQLMNGHGSVHGGVLYTLAERQPVTPSIWWSPGDAISLPVI